MFCGTSSRFSERLRAVTTISPEHLAASANAGRWAVSRVGDRPQWPGSDAGFLLTTSAHVCCRLDHRRNSTLGKSLRQSPRPLATAEAPRSNLRQ